MDRRSFFRRLAGRPEPLRPPFALPEAEFVEACNGCSDCVKACPEGIVRINSLGFAEVDFASGGCTFCDACAQSCGRGAFYQQRAARAPWDAKALVAYLRSVPPVDNKVEPIDNTKMAEMMGPIPKAKNEPVPDDPVGKGAYVASIMHCAMCHSEHHGAGFALVNRRSFAVAGVADVERFDHLEQGTKALGP